MADWIFTTPTVDEAPFAWNPLMERYRLTRAISIFEESPGAYREVRYDTYTNELDILNAGLNYFRGGYEHIVDDATRTALIASGLVDASNFTPA